MNTRKPNLFIVGAPKCGTTSLRDYLNQNKEIWFDIEIEPNFFANDVFGCEDITDWKWYNSLFKKAEDQKYLGDKSPLLLYSKEAAKRIKKFSPDAKIIIILRQPAEMIYSWHNHIFLEGTESIEDFKQAIDAEDGRKKKKEKLLMTYLYRDMIRYSDQVKRYFDAFGRENVKVILFDDLKRDSKKMYLELIKFLKLTPENINFDILNESKYTYRSYFFLKVISILKNSPLPVRKVIKFFVPRSVRNFIRSLNMKEIQKIKPIDDQLKKELTKELTPEIKKLSKLIKRDLKFWYN